MSTKIQAVLVLYRMSLEDSASYRVWKATEESSEGFHATADLMVFDNTPDSPQTPPRDFPGMYRQQPNNPGLARSYNLALERAQETGATWLMLLDQDTQLTSGYFNELQRLAVTLTAEKHVVAVVPKLMENGVVQSPHPGISARNWVPLPPDSTGLLENNGQHIYNSGALMRVSSLIEIGGFPEDFWLDYLDHAVFHELRAHGGQVYLMNSSIQHALSSNAPPNPRDAAFLARHANVLAAEALYYKRYGNPEVRRWYQRRLLRATAYSALKHRHFRMAWRTLRAALRVRING